MPNLNWIAYLNVQLKMNVITTHGTVLKIRRSQTSASYFPPVTL